MHDLKQIDIVDAWNSLLWQSGRLTRTNGRTTPLEQDQAPSKPGLYRVTWDGVDDWKNLPTRIAVRASKRILTPYLSIERITPPVVLTIGRTTNLYGRIRQHLGTNENNNRLFMRLTRMLDTLSGDQIRGIALRSLLIEWVEVPSWSHRCLLERYGSIVCMPLFDIDAEH